MSVSQELITTDFLLSGTVMPKSHENQILTLSTQQRCKSLCNHGLFKYSVCLATVTLLVILSFLRGDP